MIDEVLLVLFRNQNLKRRPLLLVWLLLKYLSLHFGFMSIICVYGAVLKR
jgi:hypothetical protein